MQSNASLSQNKKEFRLFVTTSFSNLVQLKEEGDKASFNKLVLEIIPEIRKYVNGKLNAAILKGHFPKGKYKADDFIDQLFIEIYDHIEEVENQEYFYLWLYKKINQLLEDSIVEEESMISFLKTLMIIQNLNGMRWRRSLVQMVVEISC